MPPVVILFRLNSTFFQRPPANVKCNTVSQGSRCQCVLHSHTVRTNCKLTIACTTLSIHSSKPSFNSTLVNGRLRNTFSLETVSVRKSNGLKTFEERILLFIYSKKNYSFSSIRQSSLKLHSSDDVGEGKNFESFKMFVRIYSLHLDLFNVNYSTPVIGI